jgi:hypothetical protein
VPASNHRASLLGFSLLHPNVWRLVWKVCRVLTSLTTTKVDAANVPPA